jgi:ethanolamine utilization protein EutN
MILGKVFGAVYSTINHPFYDNRRLLLVEQLKKDGRSSGKYLIAIDTVDAGAGETVLIVDEGNSARQIVDDSSAPLRSVIVGIVDHIDFQ